MTSGGTRPSTGPSRRTACRWRPVSGSDHHTGGTGTSLSSPTSRMTSYWRFQVVPGEDGTVLWSGASRAASRSWRARRPPASRPSAAASRWTCRWPTGCSSVMREVPRLGQAPGEPALQPLPHLAVVATRADHVLVAARPLRLLVAARPRLDDLPAPRRAAVARHVCPLRPLPARRVRHCRLRREAQTSSVTYDTSNGRWGGTRGAR